MSDNEQLDFLCQKAHQEEQLAAAMERSISLLPDPPLDSPLRLTAEKAPQEVSVPGVEDALWEQVAQLERMVKELQEANRQTAEQTAVAKAQAEAAVRQAKTAEDQAVRADEDSKLAREQSRKANLISVLALLVSLAVPVISYLLDRFF